MKSTMKSNLKKICLIALIISLVPLDNYSESGGYMNRFLSWSVNIPKKLVAEHILNYSASYTNTNSSTKDWILNVSNVTLWSILICLTYHGGIRLYNGIRLYRKDDDQNALLSHQRVIEQFNSIFSMHFNALEKSKQKTISDAFTSFLAEKRLQKDPSYATKIANESESDFKDRKEQLLNQKKAELTEAQNLTVNNCNAHLKHEFFNYRKDLFESNAPFKSLIASCTENNITQALQSVRSDKSDKKTQDTSTINNALSKKGIKPLTSAELEKKIYDAVAEDEKNNNKFKMDELLNDLTESSKAQGGTLATKVNDKTLQEVKSKNENYQKFYKDTWNENATPLENFFNTLNLNDAEGNPTTTIDHVNLFRKKNTQAINKFSDIFELKNNNTWAIRKDVKNALTKGIQWNDKDLLTNLNKMLADFEKNITNNPQFNLLKNKSVENTIPFVEIVEKLRNNLKSSGKNFAKSYGSKTAINDVHDNFGKMMDQHYANKNESKYFDKETFGLRTQKKAGWESDKTAKEKFYNDQNKKIDEQINNSQTVLKFDEQCNKFNPDEGLEKALKKKYAYNEEQLKNVVPNRSLINQYFDKDRFGIQQIDNNAKGKKSVGKLMKIKQLFIWLPFVSYSPAQKITIDFNKKVDLALKLQQSKKSLLHSKEKYTKALKSNDANDRENAQKNYFSNITNYLKALNEYTSQFNIVCSNKKPGIQDKKESLINGKRKSINNIIGENIKAHLNFKENIIKDAQDYYSKNINENSSKEEKIKVGKDLEDKSNEALKKAYLKNPKLLNFVQSIKKNPKNSRNFNFYDTNSNQFIFNNNNKFDVKNNFLVNNKNAVDYNKEFKHTFI